MIVIPSIQLRDGCCVQVGSGASASERIRLPDPVGIAREFSRVGFARLHLIDLDAAEGRGSNAGVVRDLIREVGMDVQAGGGLADEDTVRVVLDAGARWAVVGRPGLRDLDWLSALAAGNPGDLILAIDVSPGRGAVSGWSRTLPHEVVELVEEVADIPLAGVLVTAVDRGGRLEGPDLHLIEDVVDVARVPVIAAGGIATIAYLRNLEDRGAGAAVVGTALYTGALSPSAVASEFAT